MVVLDSLDTGMETDWAKEKLTGTSISLPGTLDDARLGKKNTLQPAMDNTILWGLTRKHQYIGAAWYQKEIEVPATWKGKKIELELERVIWESSVFVDGKLAGKNESLSAAFITHPF